MIWVRDNILSESLLRAVQASWPEIDWPHWHHYQGDNGDKYGSKPHAPLPAACQQALNQMAERVSLLIGNDSFVDYDLHAAGLHQIPPGGFLANHLDAICHPAKRWRRTHSVVLFLDTLIEQGGELLLPPDERVTPRENRLVLFETPGQWHEVLPTDITAPWRRTLALFAWAVDPGCTGATRAHFEPRPKRRAETDLQEQYETP